MLQILYCKFRIVETGMFVSINRFIFLWLSNAPLSLITCSKFEKEFNTELQTLGPILSSSSQTEPYLTHLAQCILGVGNEQ